MNRKIEGQKDDDGRYFSDPHVSVSIYRNPDVVTYARTEMDKVRQLIVSDADKKLILGGNIARLLDLK